MGLMGKNSQSRDIQDIDERTSEWAGTFEIEMLLQMIGQVRRYYMWCLYKPLLFTRIHPSRTTTKCFPYTVGWTMIPKQPQKTTEPEALEVHFLEHIWKIIHLNTCKCSAKGLSQELAYTNHALKRKESWERSWADRGDPKTKRTKESKEQTVIWDVCCFLNRWGHLFPAQGLWEIAVLCRCFHVLFV